MREDAAAHTIAHCLAQRESRSAGCGGGKVERFPQDLLTDRADALRMRKDDPQAHPDIQQRRQRDEHAVRLQDRLPSAAQHHGCGKGKGGRADPGRKIERHVQSGADAGSRHQRAHGERRRHAAQAEACRRGRMTQLFQDHHRAAAPALRRLDLACAGQRDLHILEHHTGQRAHAHPEHRARSAHGERCRHADHPADPQRAGQRGKKRILALLLPARSALDAHERITAGETNKIQRAQDQQDRHPLSPDQLIELCEHPLHAHHLAAVYALLFP